MRWLAVAVLVILVAVTVLLAWRLPHEWPSAPVDNARCQAPTQAATYADGQVIGGSWQGS